MREMGSFPRVSMLTLVALDGTPANELGKHPEKSARLICETLTYTCETSCHRRLEDLLQLLNPAKPKIHLHEHRIDRVMQVMGSLSQTIRVLSL